MAQNVEGSHSGLVRAPAKCLPRVYRGRGFESHSLRQKQLCGENLKTKLGAAVPADLAASLQENEQMLAMWDGLRPSCQRTYIKYLDEAKKPETRARRIARVLRMTAEYYERHQK